MGHQEAWNRTTRIRLVLAVVILAMLSAESDQFMIQELPESFTGEMRGSPTAGPCEGTAPKTEVAEVPPETLWISHC